MSEPGAPIELRTLPNLRSLGGWRTGDGRRVREGVLYRSTDLSQLDEADAASLSCLGISRVVDFRTADECAQRVDADLPGADRVALDVLADSGLSAAAEMATILEEPARAAELLGGGQAEQLLADAYRDIVSLPSAYASYRAFLHTLADDDPGGATLFHCTTGKDRTGWASAVTLLILGVSEQDVMREYLLTNEQLLPSLQPVFARFAAVGGDPDLLRPIFGVLPEYLRAAFAEVERRHGGLAAYLTDGLGLDDDTRARLRNRLTEPAAGQ